MEIEIDALKVFWEGKGISSLARPGEEISKFNFGGGVFLPDDLIKYFSVLNGMESLYPNEFDDEGFLFYPLQGLVTSNQEFSKPIEKDILIIAEYMHKSWWYGLKVIDKDTYSIGIIPEENKFKILTDSLSEFLKMYMSNSHKLYSFT